MQHTVQDLFKKTKAEWLDGARAVAIKKLRQQHVITIEDILVDYPLPKYLHKNTIGAVFKDNHFVSIGFTRSLRQISNGRVIQRWVLSDRYKVEEVNDCE